MTNQEQWTKAQRRASLEVPLGRIGPFGLVFWPVVGGVGAFALVLIVARSLPLPAALSALIAAALAVAAIVGIRRILVRQSARFVAAHERHLDDIEKFRSAQPTGRSPLAD